MAALVALTIPFTARIRGMLRGLLGGLGLGLAGAGGIGLGLNKMASRVAPDELIIAASLAALTTVICCGATGAVFAFLAERRQRRWEGQ